MTQTITGLFDRHADARRAVEQLEALGVPRDDISLVGRDDDFGKATAGEAAATDASIGAGVGATVGGVSGLLAGLGLLAIPGVGPVVAAGWLAAAAAGAAGGAVIGGATGGLVGGLTRAGVSEADANTYAEGVRRGGTLVTAKVDQPLVPETEAILQGERTVDVTARRHAYEAEGWNRFDETAPVYSQDEIEAERARYSAF